MTNKSFIESDKDLIKQWYYKNLPKDYFSAFTTLWIGFNAYYKRKFSGVNGDHNMVISLYTNEEYKTLFANLMENKNFSKTVKDLKEELAHKPLIRMNNKDKYNISDEPNIEEVFEALYVVRNNLFHGDKEITDERDEKIVKFSYQILKQFMKEIISRDFKIGSDRYDK